MSGLTSVLADASQAAGDASGVIGFFIIVGFLWALVAAANRKKSYRVSGRVEEI